MVNCLCKLLREGLVLDAERKGERETYWAREFSFTHLIACIKHLLCAMHWHYSYDKSGQGPVFLEPTVHRAMR